MNYMEDIDLINKIKLNNDSIALKQLESRHSGICHQIIRKYYKNLIDFGLDPEEIAEDKMLIIYKSAINFNLEKNTKFSTWVGNQMRYHCLNCMNKKANTIAMDNESIRSAIEKKQIYDHDKTLDLKERSEEVLSILDKMKDSRIKNIFKQRYFNGKKLTPWHIIGKTNNLSTQTVINLHNKGRSFLKKKLTKGKYIDTI